MAAITESRLAMYEGMIALAWADHTLEEAEQAGLRELIDGNPRFTPEQRAGLYARIQQPATLAQIWPRITEKQDRAHLLDIASVIFLKDGEYCSTERELYENFLAQHLATLDTSQTLQEIRALAADLRQQRINEEAELKSYVTQHGIVGRLKRFLGAS